MRDDGLPGLVIIGAMKCGTTALHGLLGRHPDLAMSEPKELNFFFGPTEPPAPGTVEAGNWWRGVDWYASRFPDGARLRGEASPGYTSPDHPEAAERMAEVVPDARLIYLVRDPLERAVSQYLHHRRDGAEPRPMDAALLDPDSQYVARSRFHERLVPFLEHYPTDRILVVDQRDLAARPAATLATILDHLEVPATTDVVEPAAGGRSTHEHPPVDPAVRAAFEEAVADDQERLRALLTA